MSEPSEVEMEHSQSLASFAGAMAKAQGAMRNASKDKVNPHFKSKYADLASVLDACREALATNGIAVLQPVTTCADGVRVTTMLLHSSGEWMKCHCVMPVAQRTPQGIGSAITYGRRYGLAAMVGVAADEDDDGNAASAGGGQQAQSNGNGSHAKSVASQLKGANGKQEARPAEVTKFEKPKEPTIWEQMEIACDEYGVSREGLRPMIKALNLKASTPKELTAADLAAVRKALADAKAARDLAESKLSAPPAQEEAPF